MSIHTVCSYSKHKKYDSRAYHTARKTRDSKCSPLPILFCCFLKCSPLQIYCEAISLSAQPILWTLLQEFCVEFVNNFQQEILDMHLEKAEKGPTWKGPLRKAFYPESFYNVFACITMSRIHNAFLFLITKSILSEKYLVCIPPCELFCLRISCFE